MRPVIAIDAHKDSCTYVARHWNETTVGPTRIPTTEAALRELAATYPDHEFVTEVCNVHEWMIDLFRECGVRAMAVIPPKKGPVGKKSDDDDAARLARKHQAGELTEVYIASPEVRALRDIVRQHEFLKRKRVACNNNLKHALIRWNFQPIKPPETNRSPDIYTDEGRRQVLQRLPHLESTYAVIDILDDRLKTIGREIDAEGRKILDVRILTKCSRLRTDHRSRALHGDRGDQPFRPR